MDRIYLPALIPFIENLPSISVVVPATRELSFDASSLRVATRGVSGLYSYSILTAKILKSLKVRRRFSTYGAVSPINGQERSVC